MRKLRLLFTVLAALLAFLCATGSAAAARDRTPPTRPGTLKASSVTETSVKLSWGSSKDKTGVVYYRIYRNGRYIASTKSTCYTAKGLARGKTYSFYIKARDKYWNISRAGNTLRVRTLTRDTQKPSSPYSLKTTAATPHSISLSWSKPYDNRGVTAYTVYINNVKKAEVKTASFTAEGLNPETAYSFSVRAKDAAGNISAASAVLTVTTAPKPQLTPPPVPEPGKAVMGYYAGWAAYQGYTPEDIPAENLSHILYAFANIGADHKIAMGDPTVDNANFAALRELKKQYPHVKTLISIGGWTWSGRFSDVALTEERRAAFAQSAVDFIVQHGFDGVDIDWEYPVCGGLAGNAARPEDKRNFTLLMEKLREMLDTQGQKDDTHYLLTFAGGAGAGYAANTELAELTEIADYGIIMAYDIHGAWDCYTDFNAPLYRPSCASPQYKWSADDAVKLWQSKGFAKPRIVMGVPFYGQGYTSANDAGDGLLKPFNGGGALSYDAIKSVFLSDAGYTRYYHTEAKVPWLFNGARFISYDDEESLAAKAAYIKAAGIAGAGIWELSNNADGTLLEALYNGLQ